MEGFRALYGITRDQLAAIREFVPDWSKDNTILPVYENGKYKYIDFSHGFFYDTMTSPVVATVNKVDELDEAPLLEGIVKGMGAAFAKAVQPFVSESIYFGAVMDIFTRNSYANGLLLICLDKNIIIKIINDALSSDSYEIKVHLESNTITLPNGENISFTIDDSYKERILNNLDDIELTLKHKNKITEYENKIKQTKPWLFNNE